MLNQFPFVRDFIEFCTLMLLSKYKLNDLSLIFEDFSIETLLNEYIPHYLFYSKLSYPLNTYI